MLAGGSLLAAGLGAGGQEPLLMKPVLSEELINRLLVARRQRAGRPAHYGVRQHALSNENLLHADAIVAKRRAPAKPCEWSRFTRKPAISRVTVTGTWPRSRMICRAREVTSSRVKAAGTI